MPNNSPKVQSGGKDDFSKNAKNFLKDLESSNLVVFTGCGVNAKMVPQWGELLESLFREAVPYFCSSSNVDSKDIIKTVYPPKGKQLDKETQRATLDEYAQATLIRRFLGIQYLYRLQKEIYKKCQGVGNLGSDKRFSLLQAVAGLCMNKKTEAVVTYNYDILLEKVIEDSCKEKGVAPPRSIYGPKVDFEKPGSRPLREKSKNRLPVYHIHGLLKPSEIPPEDNSGIVLCQEEYFRMMLEPFSWQTVVPLYFLRHYTCLFIGTALKDFNMLRVLFHAKAYVATQRIYVIMTEEDIGAGSGDAKVYLQRIRATLLDEIGVRLILVEGKRSGLSKFIHGLNSAIGKEG